MAFPVDLTATLSGASVSQLSNWRRTRLLIPEHASAPRALYSFRDVMALRTVVSLRRDISLQKIRRAFSSLSELSLTDHPSKYSLVTDGSSVYLVEEDEALDLVLRPGQRVVAGLTDIFEPFTNMQGRQVVDFLRPRPHLEVRERRIGGWPTIAGTRVPYDTVSMMVKDGSILPSEVPYYYPSVRAEDVADAVDFDAEVRSIGATA
ncbi:DUF433 domain-containing protein [Arthrobacter sp. Soc17.1.1.1]|uniref:DUF433 domain-containing protein n=1 Tax=Arthrobacter sp. Soc17.1.1.1 TaxID=3121277 RepID=UPI002FE433CC